MAANVRTEVCPKCGRTIGVYVPTTSHARFGTGVFRSHSKTGKRGDRSVCDGSTATAPTPKGGLR